MIDDERARAAVRELLLALGEDVDSAELRETPARVAATWAELLSGRGSDPSDHLNALQGQVGAPGQIIAVRDLAFRSVCEHHLLPFTGSAHVVYRPGAHVVGISSFAKLIDGLASRLQLQERLGDQIAEVISDKTAAHGVIVVLVARHGCLSDRGARQGTASVTTIATRGSYVGTTIADVVGLLDLRATQVVDRNDQINNS